MRRTRQEEGRTRTTDREDRGDRRARGRGIRPLALGVAGGLIAALAIAAPASAAVEFVDAPTRLYMLPNADGPLPAPIPFPLVPDGVLLFDDSQDLISQDLRKIEVVSEDPDCDFGEDYVLTGCTAIQLDVGQGLLDFTTAPTRIEYDAENDGTDDDVVYQLPGGALVRDMDSDDDLPALATAVIGTTDQVNAALDLLRYTPAQDYYYEGFNPETLSVDIVPGSGSGSLTHDIDIRVQDLNDFPEVAVPGTVYDVAPGGEVVLTPPDEWDVADVDNDEPDGDDSIDGPGEEYIIIAWSSCGSFHFQGASGMALRDDLEELIEYALDLDPGMDPTWRQTIVDAFLAIVPDDVESLPFATGNPNEYATAFAGVVDDLSWLDYHLDEITFAAVSDPVAMTPLPDGLCDVRFLVTDIGNNGLPIQYLGDPPEGVEVPFFGFEVDTNDVPGVELVQVQVGDGAPIEVSLADETVPEGSTGAVTATISPATHPAFDLTVSTADGPDAVAGSDYTAITDLVVSVPENAATVDIPVDALQDAEYEQPDETYLLTATGPATDPPGYQVTMTDASATVTIDDDDPEPDTTSPAVTIDQAAGQIDPATTLAPVLFTAQFDEPVTEFDADDDLTLSFSGAGTPVATVLPVDADTYTVSVSGMTSGGVLTASVVAGAAEDGAGNLSLASTSTDNEVTITLVPVDDVDPTVTIDQAGGQPDPVMTLDPIEFTVEFDESVTGFTDPSDVGLAFTGPGVPAAAITPIDAQTYTVAVTGFTGPGVLTATVPAGVAVDLSGNPNAASTSTDNSVTVVAPPDDVDPTVTIDQAPAQADPATTLDPIEFAVSFDEGVTGFDAISDLGLAFSGTGTLAAIITPVDAAEYTVEVSGFTSEGTLTATVVAGAAADLAGNPSAASTSTDNTVTIDLPEPANDPPVLTLPASLTTEPSTPVGVAGTVTDPDVGAGMMELEIDVSAIAGPVTADGTFTWPHGTDVTSDVFVGTLAEVNSALSGIAFTPGAGQTGVARLVVEIDDQGNTGTGGTLSDTGFTLITIAAEGDDDPDANDPPVLTLPATLATTVDTPVTVPASAADPDVGAGMMEVEIDVAAIAGPVTADGTFTWPHGADVTTDVFVGTLAEVNTALAALKFTPGAGLVGTARIVIELDDQGNSGTGGELSHTRFVDIVIDDAPPPDPLAIDVPDDIVVHAAPGEPGIEVDFEEATASGGIPPYTITCDHAAGDYFPVGATTVTCTVEDSAPEEEVELFAIASASFTITVIAVDAPDDPDDPDDPGQTGGSAPGGLASTGAAPVPALAFALLLLLAGAGAVRLSRRRAAHRA